MTKLQLVLSQNCYTSFHQPWLVDLVSDYFDIVYIEHNLTLDKRAIFVTNVLSNDNKWIDKERKLIVDNLWEIYQPSHDHNRRLVLVNKNWFWYNESLWYRYLGYHNHIPNLKISKNGLLLMHLKKLHRTELFEKLNLDNLLFSYVAAGYTISNDMDYNDGEWQRYFNPDWYNSTAFSIVAETMVMPKDPLFVTEKTFKPIAFQHPFIILGQPGILRYLRSLGFETFENIFDESYDNENAIDKRLTSVVNQINNYSHKNYDLYTLKKLTHNKELFFNEQLVKEKIKKEIIEPILEYAET
jgi:hypothetical protein